MKTLFLLLIILISSESFAQLACKKLKGRGGDSTVCYHKNGKVSTIDFETVEHERYFEFRAYDINGNESLKANHGYLHGGASLDVAYYDNGAIRSARKTFQPDGGIQHYDATSFFNEDGTFNHEEDNSWDKQLIIYNPPIYDFPEPKKAVVEPKTDTVYVYLKNTSSHKIEVLINKKAGSDQSEKVVLKKQSEQVIGYFISQGKNEKVEDLWNIYLIPNRKSTKVKRISAPELSSKTKQVIVFLEL
jgi:hypothetical protein